MAVASKVCPKCPNNLSMLASWINDLSNSWNIWNVKLFGAHVFIPLLLFPQRLIANRNWTVGQPIVHKIVHKRGILICFNACSKQCVPQSFCFLDIFPLNIKLHLIAISMDRKAPKKIRCHMTPLPLHNNHFLLSPRWLLWRGSTVSVILCRGEVYLSQLFLGMLPSSFKIKSILCHLKMLMVERLQYASFYLIIFISENK